MCKQLFKVTELGFYSQVFFQMEDSLGLRIVWAVSPLHFVYYTLIVIRNSFSVPHSLFLIGRQTERQMDRYYLILSLTSLPIPGTVI